MEYQLNNLTVFEYGTRISATLSMDSKADLKKLLQTRPDTNVKVGFMSDSFDKSYQEEDLNILNELNNIECIYFWINIIKDYSGLYCLKNLKVYNNLTDEKWGVDFGYFSEIIDIECYWNKSVKNLFSRAKLEHLILRKYKPNKINDLSEFKNLTNLVDLTITQSSIVSLVGIENLTKLEELTLAYNPKLEQTVSSKIKLENVKSLIIESCKKLDNSFIDLFPNLENRYRRLGRIIFLHFKRIGLLFINFTRSKSNIVPKLFLLL